MQPSREQGQEMHGFLGCTVEQYMTRSVVTVKRLMTRRILGLFARIC